MFARLLLLFIVVPLVDLTLLLVLTQYTHWTTTITVVVVSGIIGAWLAKRQSDSVGFKIRDQISKNQMPSGLLTDGAMILFAAALLLAPGLITDLFGLTLLIPFSRNWYKTWAVKWMKSHFKVQVTAMGGQKPFQSSDIIDGEVVSQTTDEKDSTVNKTSHLVH